MELTKYAANSTIKNLTSVFATYGTTNEVKNKYPQLKQAIVNNLIYFRGASVLVSTDVAAMGLDVWDLNISVNIGKPCECSQKYS